MGESRHRAALWEVQEETGFACHMLPLAMETRAPPAVEEGGGDSPDEPRFDKEATEPFGLSCRRLDGARGLKVIWWYIAAVDEAVGVEVGEAQFRARLVGFGEALGLLTLEQDREIVRRAIKIFEGFRTDGLKGRFDEELRRCGRWRCWRQP